MRSKTRRAACGQRARQHSKSLSPLKNGHRDRLPARCQTRRISTRNSNRRIYYINEVAYDRLLASHLAQSLVKGSCLRRDWLATTHQPTLNSDMPQSIAALLPHFPADDTTRTTQHRRLTFCVPTLHQACAISAKRCTRERGDAVAVERSCTRHIVHALDYKHRRRSAFVLTLAVIVLVKSTCA